MAIPKLSPIPLSLLAILSLFTTITSSFTPTDNYLITCGSPSLSTTDLYNRKFTSDAANFPDSNSVTLSSSKTISLTELTLTSFGDGVFSPLYNSARIFQTRGSYKFVIREKGAHLVRLHFHRFDHDDERFDLSNAKFHVLANGYVLVYDFSGLTMRNLDIKEYVLWVDSDYLEITFVPLGGSSFAFVSAVEVVSAPKDLILDTAQIVNVNSVEKIDGMSKNAYETMFRVNVGGPKVTPFNDSLWRTWVVDDGFLEGGNAESKEVHFGGRIKYQKGGASREVAPDNVYGSARVISGSDSSIAKSNLTWKFPVVDGYKYLVRTHFCDIASPTLGLLFFNVYVNGYLAYENLDLSMLMAGLASPYYADLVVDGGNSGVITVSVGPSKWSTPAGVDALLNGIEIFKLNNSMNSLDGLVSADKILRPCHGGNTGVLVPLAAALGLLVAASVTLRKKFWGLRDSVTWSRLPVDVSEVDLKSNYH